MSFFQLRSVAELTVFLQRMNSQIQGGERIRISTYSGTAPSLPWRLCGK